MVHGGQAAATGDERAPVAHFRGNTHLAARRGDKRAVVAVAHAILVIAYHLLADGGVYVDLGPNYFDSTTGLGTRSRPGSPGTWRHWASR